MESLHQIRMIEGKNGVPVLIISFSTFFSFSVHEANMTMNRPT